MFIYQIKNLTDNKLFFGFTTVDETTKWKKHLANIRKEPTSYVDKAMKKEGVTNFLFSVVENFTSYKEGEAALEAKIEEFKTNLYEFGYNLSREASEETKQKMSESRKGKTLSADIREKISIGHKGKVLTEETKQRISDSKKGKKASAETRKKMSVTRQELNKAKLT